MLKQEHIPKDYQERTNAREEYERKQREEKYLFYEPNGKLESFIKMVGENKYFINLLIAGNGVGKTSGIANILANICFNPKNKWFRGMPIYDNFPYPKKGRIISDPTTITDAIIPDLHKWFPKDKYSTSKESRKYEYRWKTSTGFEFDIMSFEQDVKEFESATLGFVIVDEPCPEAIFKASISRARAGGIVISVFTPLQGSAYFYDNFVTSPHTQRYG